MRSAEAGAADRAGREAELRLRRRATRRDDGSDGPLRNLAVDPIGAAGCLSSFIVPREGKGDYIRFSKKYGPTRGTTPEERGEPEAVPSR